MQSAMLSYLFISIRCWPLRTSRVLTLFKLTLSSTHVFVLVPECHENFCTYAMNMATCPASIPIALFDSFSNCHSMKNALVISMLLHLESLEHMTLGKRHPMSSRLCYIPGDARIQSETEIGLTLLRSTGARPHRPL